MGSLFKVLLDATGISHALSKVNLGDSITSALNGILAFAFRDSSGNAVAPQLNSEGAVVVSFDAGTCIRGLGSLLKGVQVDATEAQVAEINLTADRSYSCPSILISSFRDLKYRVAYVDDASGVPSETNLYQGVLGGAQINKDIVLKKDCFDTTGGTGDQRLRVYATPVETGVDKDDIFCQLSVNELA